VPVEIVSSEELFGQPRSNHHNWSLPSQRETLNGLLTRYADQLKAMLRQPLTSDDLLDLAAIPNGYQIRVLSSWRAGLRVNIAANNSSSSHTLERSIRILEDGKIIINDHQNNSRKRQGIGVTIFAHQVAKASAFGFQSIRMKAARGPTMNGYYTWVRFGCNGILGNKRSKRLMQAFSRETGYEFPFQPETIHDLLDVELGLELWKSYGDTIEVFFDLMPDSRCWKILNDYLQDKNLQLAIGWIKP
jgi:hypothetical protein